MDPKIKAIRRERWFKIIIAAANSGMTKEAWCREHNISSKSFFRWQKIIRSEEADRYQQELSRSQAYPSEHFPGTNNSGFAIVYENPSLPDRVTSIETEASIRPEMILQAGKYQMLIGSGITEATLTTVLRVIAHA